MLQQAFSLFSPNSLNPSLGCISRGRLWRPVWSRRWGGKYPLGSEDSSQTLKSSFQDPARCGKKAQSCCARDSVKLEDEKVSMCSLCVIISEKTPELERRLARSLSPLSLSASRVASSGSIFTQFKALCSSVVNALCHPGRLFCNT